MAMGTFTQFESKFKEKESQKILSTQSLLAIILEKKTFINIGTQHFLLFPQYFLGFLNQNSIFSKAVFRENPEVLL